MEQTDIKKREDAIATFMGYTLVKIGYFGTRTKTKWQVDNEKWMDKVGLDNIGNFWVNIKEDKFIDADNEGLHYHSSWDSLMPVIEKINQLRYPIYIYQSHVQNSCQIMELTSNEHLIRHSSNTSKIDPVFLAVSDFCIWKLLPRI